jgi:hypothetical protein
MSEMNKFIFVGSFYEFFRAKQASAKQAGVSGKSENEHKWEDD